MTPTLSFFVGFFAGIIACLLLVKMIIVLTNEPKEI